MEKEKVTEELVRQNGNQAAAVMADYAGQGGGGGSASKGVYGTLVDVSELPCFKPMSDWPLPGGPTPAKLSDVLADGYRLIHHYFEDSNQEEFSFYIVKVTGANPTVSLNDESLHVFTDCEPVDLGVPPFASNYLVLRTLKFNFSADDTADIVGAETLEGKDLPPYYNSMDETPLVCKTEFPVDPMANPIIVLGVHIVVAKQPS